MDHADNDDERLLAYAAGELDAATAALVDAELAASPARAATAARYRAVQAILRADDSVAPPARALARAKAIVATAPAAGGLARRLGLAEAGRRLMAELTFDSGGGFAPALAGFRGQGADVRQLVFEAEGIVVDLQVEPPAAGEHRWRIIGQVDGAAEQRLVVGLAPVDDDAAAVAVTTDAYGGFQLSAVAGRYNIFVRIPDDGLVVLPNLIIG